MMSFDVEEDLRRRLRAEAAQFGLAPGAIAAVTRLGRRRMRRRALAAGAAVVALAVAGLIAVPAALDRSRTDSGEVASSGGNPNSTGGVSAGTSTPRLITRAAGEDFPGLFAHLTGTLTITADHCIAVTGKDGQRPIVVVWGHGWTAGWENGKAVVYDPSEAVFAREGDRVGLGGGSVTGAAAEPYASQPCGTDPIWVANDRQVAVGPHRGASSS